MAKRNLVCAAARVKQSLFGSVTGLLFALAVTLMIEVLNPAIRRAEHLERDLGIMPVVSIPTVRA